MCERGRGGVEENFILEAFMCVGRMAQSEGVLVVRPLSVPFCPVPCDFFAGFSCDAAPSQMFCFHFFPSPSQRSYGSRVFHPFIFLSSALTVYFVVGHLGNAQVE